MLEAWRRLALLLLLLLTWGLANWRICAVAAGLGGVLAVLWLTGFHAGKTVAAVFVHLAFVMLLTVPCVKNAIHAAVIPHL
jgi:hypothetical protein